MYIVFDFLPELEEQIEAKKILNVLRLEVEINEAKVFQSCLQVPVFHVKFKCFKSR